jgi:biotin carboxyl carrier protein
VVEEAFDALDAPIGRLHTDPVSHPFCPILEDEVTASADKIVKFAKAVLDGKPLTQHRAVGTIPKTGVKAIPAANGNGNGNAAAILTPAKPEPAAAVHAAAPAPHIPTPAPAPAPAAPVAKSIPGGIPVVMPNMDLIITEATVVAWIKKVGDKVVKGEPLLEIETDKATSQVESPADGTLAEIIQDAGAVVPLGQQLGTIAP